MKTLIKKSLLVLMVAFITVFTLGIANKVKAASYVETSFGEGKFLITSVFDGQKCYLPATTTTSGPLYKTFSDVSEISDDHLWTVTATGTNYYIQNSDGKYLYTTNTNNGVRVGDTERAWIYNSSNNSFQDSSTNRFLGVYNSSNWRCYTTVNQSNYKESSTSFKFYKVDEGSPSISIDGASYAELGTTVILTAALANVTGDVAWNSSNSEVATIDQQGNLTTLSVGQTIITAAIGEVSATLEFTVYPANESELTIAQAIEVCELTGETNSPYTYSTTGVIESIDTPYDSGYGNITVTIGDGVSSIKVFRLVGGSELAVGDKIKVTGALVNYKGNTPEFAEKCTYESVADSDSIATIKEALNQVNAYMSFAYKYTREEVETTATTSATLKYAGTTTTNMTADTNNAAIVGLDDSVFKVEAIKNAPSNNIGLNKAGTVRLYANSADGNGNALTISTLNGQNIASIKIEFDSTVGSFTVNGAAGSKETSEYAINGTSVTIKNTTTNSSTQVHIKSITINLASSGEVTNKNVFTDVDFRIKCGVDKALADIKGVESYGIKVFTADKEMELAATGDDETCLFAVISLGDALTNAERLNVVFTVQAYVVVEGITYTSELTKSFSIAQLVEVYYNNTETSEKVASLYELIQNL